MDIYNDYSEYRSYIDFIYSVAVKIKTSNDNRNEFEKVILKKIKIYKIYDVCKTDNKDSKMNKIELLALWHIYEHLSICFSIHQDFLKIIIRIMYASQLPKLGFLRYIEIIKKLLSFAK